MDFTMLRHEKEKLQMECNSQSKDIQSLQDQIAHLRKHVIKKLDYNKTIVTDSDDDCVIKVDLSSDHESESDSDDE